MTNIEAKGPLMIIGGAEEKDGKMQILREFARLAGGTDARIVVLTAATCEPEEVGRTYTRVFERLGVADIQIVDTRVRDNADLPNGVESIQQATGIFFSGGDQSKIIERIKGTKLDAAIRDRHAQGVVVGGTSAGAAMMPEIMIVGGDSESGPRLDIVDLGEGMGFLPGVIIDQHFAERGRLGRLLSALMSQPASLGFGIDENTALIVRGTECLVVGEGTITVVDESQSTHNNAAQALQDEQLALFDAKLHILAAGYGFDLTTRQPIAPQGLALNNLALVS